MDGAYYRLENYWTNRHQKLHTSCVLRIESVNSPIFQSLWVGIGSHISFVWLSKINNFFFFWLYIFYRVDIEYLLLTVFCSKSTDFTKYIVFIETSRKLYSTVKT